MRTNLESDTKSSSVTAEPRVLQKISSHGKKKNFLGRYIRSLDGYMTVMQHDFEPSDRRKEEVDSGRSIASIRPLK